MDKLTEKLDGKSKDILGENILKMKEIFPEVFCEDKIDFERLKEVLGEHIEDKEERYRFEWNGKSEATREWQKQSTGTLRPCREESKNWDDTENLYIEGDNLEVLKLLKKAYHGKIKMIYIDPPYNTGNDFIYPDNYRDNLKNYLELTAQVDEEGKRLGTNSEAGGKYHTNWLNMMYPRLRLARNLLTDDGVIFISIDDNEMHNLKKICDEIFGENNFVDIISRLMKSGSNQGKYFSKNIDYILVYAKNILLLKEFKEKLGEKLIKKVYNCIEHSGKRKGERYRAMGLYQASLEERINQRFWIKCPDGSLAIPKGDTIPNNFNEGEKTIPKSGEGVWRWTYERYLQELRDGNILFKKTDTSPLIDETKKKSKWNVYTKIWLKDRIQQGKIPVNLVTKYENRHSSKELQAIGIPFNFSKPVGLIEYLIEITTIKQGIILDFFAGSSTTAHSVMEFNILNNSNLKYIMVQMPLSIEKNSKASLAGYKNICEIGKERIRRAGEKIKQENKEKEGIENLDIGFKVFKLDSSNIKKWNPDYDNLEVTFDDMVNNFVEGRSEEDILYEVMLKFGIDLTYPIEEYNINGNKVYSIGFGALFGCFDDDIKLEVAEGIIKLKEELSPEITRVVFKDNGFKNDSVKKNIELTLKRNNIEDVMSI